MASEPGDVNPQRERESRVRRAGRHLDVASMPQEEPSTDDETPQPQQRPSAPAKPKRAGTSGMRAMVQGNARALISVAFFLIGVVLVLLGWYGAAHTNILTEQIPYLISGGLLGMALIIVAGVVASSASLERDNQEFRRDIGRAMAGTPERSRSVGAAPAHDRINDVVYTVPGGRSFHLAGCPIIEGKDATELTPDDAAEAGYTVCKLCGPD